MKQLIIYMFIVLNLNLACVNKPTISLNKEAIILSTIKGEKSKVDTLKITNNGPALKNLNIYIEGKQSDYFKILKTFSNTLIANETLEVPIEFQTDSSFIGLANAKLVIIDKADSLRQIPLRGLSTKGLEGKNEPPLNSVLKALGYSIELGWDGLANHTRSDLQGEERSQTLFKKSGNADVEMIPVARYSPSFTLPFGYYTKSDLLPVLHEVGVLSDLKTYPEHQTLFPTIISGGTTFNPLSDVFGFYTTSPSHDAYSEDVWNIKLFKKHAAHACRIYPVKNLEGKLIPNQFLVCFEEAFNGDYQDYVFLLKNIEVVDYSD